MSVADEYPLGSRVTMMLDVRPRFAMRQSFTGTVVGHSRDGSLFYLVMDGQTSRQRWSPSFFERLNR